MGGSRCWAPRGLGVLDANQLAGSRRPQEMGAADEMRAQQCIVYIVEFWMIFYKFKVNAR